MSCITESSEHAQAENRLVNTAEDLLPLVRTNLIHTLIVDLISANPVATILNNLKGLSLHVANQVESTLEYIITKEVFRLVDTKVISTLNKEYDNFDSTPIYV